jgi:hypothetical protein
MRLSRFPVLIPVTIERSTCSGVAVDIADVDIADVDIADVDIAALLFGKR